MNVVPLITTCQFGNKHVVKTEWRGVYIFPERFGKAQTYTTRRNAIRGAVRALRRIGYHGEYQVSLI